LFDFEIKFWVHFNSEVQLSVHRRQHRSESLIFPLFLRVSPENHKLVCEIIAKTQTHRHLPTWASKSSEEGEIEVTSEHGKLAVMKATGSKLHERLWVFSSAGFSDICM